MGTGCRVATITADGNPASAHIRKNLCSVSRSCHRKQLEYGDDLGSEKVDDIS